MEKGNIFIVAAPSGAGKTTLVSALLAADANVKLSVSFTTRSPRPGEENGKDYHFVSRDAFVDMIGKGDFLEHAEVYGNFYGTSEKWIREQLATGQDILLEIDWQGAQQVRKLFPEAISVFILPPSLEVLEQRLRGRGKDSEEAIQVRLKSAQDEIRHVDEYDYVIVNELIDASVHDIISIVRAARLRIVNQSRKFAQLMSELKGV
ncbi:guanylate kinase [Leeia sp. TBRC 13508]|uniref:Guanylate kinase n=1 Tax=Leeia speluncae TaxID=2884804 RepID=A0ABS8D4Y9_9NEIS|nr:guanylate kinase [Leeia speluncae]MCB6183294.1 guanylate kinase [Leeia speluncae]